MSASSSQSGAAGSTDLWEGANALEHTTHPYEGTIYDNDGKAITYKDQYRVDFITDRAERFIRQKHDKPFFLFISQLEPHQQNDWDNRIIGPKGSAERFANAHVPGDLRDQPGNWQQKLPDYYGACEAIDASVGRVRKILDEEKLCRQHVFVFLSDHGCHFRPATRSTSAASTTPPPASPSSSTARASKARSRSSRWSASSTSHPPCSTAAGVPIPPTMKGRASSACSHQTPQAPTKRQSWRNEQLIQVTESMTGRAIRTPEWTYCVAEITGQTKSPQRARLPGVPDVRPAQDLHERTNLAGRKEFRKQADELSARLKTLIAASGEPEPEIRPAKLYP